jgi:6-phosphofructokinase
MTIFHKLHRKGLNTVCIPRSIENDIAATAVSFGFNSALSFTIEMLDRVRQAAQSARKIGVVEVLGSQAGWLALQSGIAVCADAVLIPEIPCDLKKVAERLKEKVTPRRPYALVVVAEGAKFAEDPQAQATPSSLKATLSPLATGDASEHVIRQSGQAAEAVATRLQLLIAEETFPLVLGTWVRGGSPTAVDRQLGLGYGAGAVRAIAAGKYGTMMAFVPPDIKYVPLNEAINKVRTVPADSEFVQIARSLGICLGREL